jgi:hypothetical protein
MPMMTIAFFPLEFVIAPGTTYVLIGGSDHYRRIFTDGDDWPKNLQSTYAGYSIGRWIDEDGDGTYDVLKIETCGPFKGPRVTMPAACPSISIINLFSRNACIGARMTPLFSTTRSPCSIPR